MTRNGEERTRELRRLLERFVHNRGLEPDGPPLDNNYEEDAHALARELRRTQTALDELYAAGGGEYVRDGLLELSLRAVRRFLEISGDAIRDKFPRDAKQMVAARLRAVAAQNAREQLEETAAVALPHRPRVAVELWDEHETVSVTAGALVDTGAQLSLVRYAKVAELERKLDGKILRVGPARTFWPYGCDVYCRPLCVSFGGVEGKVRSPLGGLPVYHEGRWPFTAESVVLGMDVISGIDVEFRRPSGECRVLGLRALDEGES